MKKVIAVMAAGVLSVALLGGCSSGNASSSSSSASASTEAPQEEVKAEPLNLDGTWKSINSDSPDSWQEAVIDGDTITINWVSDNGDTKSLYWAGTVVEPTDETVDDSYTWDSVNDKEQTSGAMLASGDDTKTFTYDKGELSYEASAMGTTETVRMERI